MKTVVICDREPIAVEGLRGVIGSVEGLRLEAAESCLATGMEAFGLCRPDVLVIDKGFGLAPVLDALRELRAAGSEARVVVWGDAVSNAEALRLLHAGATGVVRKTASVGSLIDCLTAVAAGSTWIEDGLMQTPAGGLRKGQSPLTARELEVMELVERGLTNRDIAGALGIRTGTVKIHLRHIFEKTGIHGRYGLALSGLREKGLVAAAVM